MKIFFSVSVFVVLFSPSTAQSFKVTLQTPNYKNGLAYLTYYYGKNINIEDSAIISDKGVGVFEKKEKLLPGVYSIVFPGKNKLFDFLVDKEQAISIKADTTDLINKTIVIGSKENILFQQYQKFVAAKGSNLQKEIDAYKGAKTKSDSLSHEKNYNNLNKELNDYRDKIIKENPESMLAALLTSMKEPKILIAKQAIRQLLPCLAGVRDRLKQMGSLTTRSNFSGRLASGFVHIRQPQCDHPSLMSPIEHR